MGERGVQAPQRLSGLLQLPSQLADLLVASAATATITALPRYRPTSRTTQSQIPTPTPSTLTQVEFASGIDSRLKPTWKVNRPSD